MQAGILPLRALPAGRLDAHLCATYFCTDPKEKFDPVWEPRYLVTRGGMSLPRVVLDVAALISGGLSGVVAR